MKEMLNLSADKKNNRSIVFNTNDPIPKSQLIKIKQLHIDFFLCSFEKLRIAKSKVKDGRIRKYKKTYKTITRNNTHKEYIIDYFILNHFKSLIRDIQKKIV